MGKIWSKLNVYEQDPGCATSEVLSLSYWCKVSNWFFVGELPGGWIYDDNFSAHFPGVIDGCLCPTARDFPADSQKNVCMVDHEFIALHHTFFVVISADVNNRIRLFQNGAIENLRWTTPVICLRFTWENAMEFNRRILFPDRQNNDWGPNVYPLCHPTEEICHPNVG